MDPKSAEMDLVVMSHDSHDSISHMSKGQKIIRCSNMLQLNHQCHIGSPCRRITCLSALTPTTGRTNAMIGCPGHPNQERRNVHLLVTTMYCHLSTYTCKPKVLYFFSGFIRHTARQYESEIIMVTFFIVRQVFDFFADQCLPQWSLKMDHR